MMARCSISVLIFIAFSAFFSSSLHFANAFAPTNMADNGFGAFSNFFKDLGNKLADKFEEFCDKYSSNADENAIRLHNWGNNFNYSTMNIQYPKTVAQVQHVVRNARKLRVVGSRHSFSKIADSQHTMLSTMGLNAIISFDESKPSVLVQAGITYTDLAPTLESNGYALANLAALAEISVGGAIQTGTHGSGPTLANLASQVRSLELVLANGTRRNYTRADAEFRAVTVGLGAFGVVTQVELQLERSYNVTTYTILNLPVEAFYANFDAINALAYNGHYVSTMANTSVIDAVTLHVRGDQANQTVRNLTQLYGGTVVVSTTACGQPVVQTWYDGLLVFPLGQSGVDGNDFQTEYFVAQQYVEPAVKAIFNLSGVIRPVLAAFVIRTIRNDNFMMSQCSGNTTGDGFHVALQFSWVPSNLTAVFAVTPQIEAALKPFGARVHWGKYSSMKPQQLLPNYPEVNQFRNLANQLDPTGKFRNDYLNQNVFVNV